MAKILRRTQFGNPILRQKAQRLTPEEITSPKIQSLIADMHHTLLSKNYGIGIAAPQLGRSVAISVIAIRKTKARPNAEPFKLTIINPEIIKMHGPRERLWEGCLSFGGTKDAPFAKVPRYTKVTLRYHDEQGHIQEADFEGLSAHVVQHETDHLNGILFVDKVTDTTSYVTQSEYVKRYRTV